MNNLTLSIQSARDLALAAQGLLTDYAQPVLKPDLLATIRRIHALQIDTINVVARAPYHILWSRLGRYDPAWLEKLHGEGALFEYWAHAACFLPIEDYPLYRRVMLDERVGWDNITQWGSENKQMLDDILAHIRQNGPVRSADFSHPNGGGTWWNWKVEKVALEYLFTRGDLMIARREKFQRVYDLRERVLPGWDDNNAPSYEDALRRQVLNAVQALGVAREDWVAPYFYLPKLKVSKLLPELTAEGELIQVAVEGTNGRQAYVHPANAGLLNGALEGSLNASKTTLLSPFDPLISDRARTKALFDFDYTIECYTPAPKRIYGYFVLPILRRGRLIGRLDAKAWRKEGRLEVIKIFLEPGIDVSHDLVTDLKGTLQDYATWQGLNAVTVTWSNPADLAERLV
jgi:uncharacterized protein YcaQ